MKKNQRKFIVLVSLFLVLFLSHCGYIIFVPSGKTEKVENFKVSQDTKPSELIMKFLGENYINEKNNYAITFIDEFCGASLNQVQYCNLLYKVSQDNFNWYAVSMYDSIGTAKWRDRNKINPDSFRYFFPTFYEVSGLNSSLYNLYYKNNPVDGLTSPMTFIIANNKIERIFRGSINSEEKFLQQKNLLDSLTQNSNNLNEE